MDVDDVGSVLASGERVSRPPHECAFCPGSVTPPPPRLCCCSELAEVLASPVKVAVSVAECSSFTLSLSPASFGLTTRA